MTRVTWLVIGVALGSIGAPSASAQTIRSSVERSFFQGPGQASADVAAAFPQEARFAFVDVDRVAALSREGKAAASRLEELRGKKAAELSARGKQVEALQLKLSQGTSMLTEVARRRLEREFQRAHVDFQRLTEDAQEEVRELQQELTQAFTAKLFPVIGEIAIEKKLWAVFSSESALLWHDPALDLSEEVARRLDSTATPPR